MGGVRAPEGRLPLANSGVPASTCKLLHTSIHLQTLVYQQLLENTGIPAATGGMEKLAKPGPIKVNWRILADPVMFSS